MRARGPVALLVLALAVAACGVPGSGGVSVGEVNTVVTTGTTTTTVADSYTAFECPVTIPPQPGFLASKPGDVTYSEHFPEPDPWPASYPHEGMVWHGTDDLWTALPVDGDYGVRKSVWWSDNFPGGILEEQPDLSVTWTRLDSDEPHVVDNGRKATNAFTPGEGWFMIAGIDPAEPGCWEVTASYKGAGLTYVYEMTG